MKFKGLSINLFLILCSFVFAVAVAEIGLRIINKDRTVPLVADDILHHKAVPNTDWAGNGFYLFDANGFRNKNVPKKADIVALGDSMTMGFHVPVDQAWPQVLEQISGRTVYQMALGQYAVPQYYYLLDRALELEPKIVMIGFYLGNDLFDAYDLVYSQDYWQFWRGSSTPAVDIDQEIKKSARIRKTIVYRQDPEDRQKSNIAQWRAWFRGHSRVYALLGDSSRGLREKIGLADSLDDQYQKLDQMDSANPGLVSTYKQKPINTILSPAYRRDAIDLDHPVAREGFRIHQQLFLAMHQRLKSENRSMVIVIIPTKELIYGTLMEAVGQEMTDALKENVDMTRRLVGEALDFCAVNGIHGHDLTADLARALKNNTKMFADNLGAHPLSAGYKEIAESINNFLLQLPPQ